MTQEDKDILLKYLCMALPYKVICEDMEGKTRPLFGITPTRHFIVTLDNATDGTNGLKLCTIDCVKPYLRPMSSMTMEEEFEYHNICVNPINRQWNVVDWLNAHHFDYRGLIEKGIAIAVTEENNPYKN